MTDKFWIADPDGAKAFVEGATDREEWVRVRGWTEAAAPSAGDFVWLQHEVSEGRQKFPFESVHQWAPLGWHPAQPAPPADLTKALVDQAAPVAEPNRTAEVPKTTSKARAASGVEKE